MPIKEFETEQLGKIYVIKRKSSRHLRITIAPDGDIKVSIPNWVPYKNGLDFALAKSEWINKSRISKRLITEGQQIGRSHHIYFQQLNSIETPKANTNQNQIIIKFPTYRNFDDDEVQKVARKAAIKALRKQAEILLPQRLATISKSNLLPYNEVQIKQLKRRWGSCDQSKRIVLNLYLIQLPWELIDYVLLHELSHTKHLNHGSQFWSLLESMAPNAKDLRKTLNSYHPNLIEA